MFCVYSETAAILVRVVENSLDVRHFGSALNSRQTNFVLEIEGRSKNQRHRQNRFKSVFAMSLLFVYYNIMIMIIII